MPVWLSPLVLNHTPAARNTGLHILWVAEKRNMHIAVDSSYEISASKDSVYSSSSNASGIA